MRDVEKAGLNPTQEFAKVFGLSTKATPTAKKGGFLNKVGSSITSFGDGLKESVGGIAQIDNWAKDKIGQGINKITGKDIAPTDNLGSYNRRRKAEGTVSSEFRSKAALDGFDLSKLAGEVAGTAPIMMGTPMGAGAKGAATFAGKEFVLGATSGAIREADNLKQRGLNMALEGVGGAAGGVVGEKVVAPVARKVGSKIARSTANRTGATTRASEKLVDDAIKETGIDVTPVARRDMVKEADDLLKKGKQADAPALVRKNLLDRHGVGGTQAQITRNPAQWTDEKEAAKFGQNNPLREKYIQDHEELDRLMRELVGETGAQPTDNYTRMSSTFNTLKKSDEAAQAKVGELYGNARSMSGNEAQLNPNRFVDSTLGELDSGNLTPFLPDNVNKLLADMDNGGKAFTYKDAEQLILILNDELRSAKGASKRAIGTVRDNLQKEVDRSIDEMTGLIGQGSDEGLATAKEAWQEARGLAKKRFTDIESVPMLKAVLDDAEPDKALNKFLVNGNVSDITKTVDYLKSVDGGDQAIKDMQGAVVDHLLQRATKSNSGTFSPAAFNTALNSLGTQRMKALFSPQQISRLHNIKQVVDILTQEPLGAAPNRSNTSSTLIKQLLGVVDVVGRLPVAGNALLGTINVAKDLVGSGAAQKMANGQVPVTKNSSLGLTPEMLEMLGLVQNVSTTLPAATGAALAGD